MTFYRTCTKVAKADGRVQELETQLIGILKKIFNEEKEKSNDTKEIAQSLNKLLGRSRLKSKKTYNEPRRSF